MKDYTQKLRTKAHETAEDDFFNYTHPSGQRGAYIIADGLSGIGGDFASNLAVTQLGLYVKEQLEKDTVTPEVLHKDISGKIRQIHERLYTRAQTTLDSVIISDNTAIIHHLGDSRVYFVYANGDVKQVTKDESKQTADMGPSNSLGGRGEINEQALPLQDVRYIFLCTDGVMSRVTDQQITTLLGTLTSEEAPFLLEKFVKLIKYPKEKLRDYPKETLYNLLEGKEKWLPPEIDQLIELIFSKYYGRDADVTARVDKESKVDDTTMILVDIEDTVSKSIAVQGMRDNYESRIQELQEETKENAEVAAQGKALREAVDKADGEKRDLTLRLVQVGSENKQQIERLARESAAAQEREGTERERANKAEQRYNGLHDEYTVKQKAWDGEKGSLEGLLKREEAETGRLNTELQRANSQYQQKSGEWTAEKARLEEQRKVADAAKQGADRKYDELAKKEQRWINEQEELGRLRLEVPDLRTSKSRLEIQVNEAKATLTRRETEYQKDKEEWGKDKKKLNEEKAEVVAERNMIRTEYDADKEEWRTKEASLEQKATQYEQERNDAVARQQELIMQNSGLVAKLSKLQEDHFKLQEGNSKLQGDYASMAKQFADQKVAWEEKEPKYQREIARLKAEQGVTSQDNQQSKSIGNELTRLDSVAEAYKPNGKPQEAAVSLPTSTPSKTSDQKKWYSRLGSFLSRR